MSAPTRNATEFVGKVIEDATGMMTLRLCAIGDRLDLFATIAEHGPLTSAELAARTHLNERYLREWIYGIALAGYLDFDKESRKVSMPDAHRPALVDAGGPLYQGGLFRMFNAILDPYEDLILAFRNGGGIDYSRYGDDFWRGLEHNSCVRYKNLLVSKWLPEMPDVVAKLDAGGSFADFGCGAGRAVIELAKRFPRAQFHGFDLFPGNIDTAPARQALPIGQLLRNRIFRKVWTVASMSLRRSMSFTTWPIHAAAFESCVRHARMTVSTS
jgi:hypothetical protein